MTLRAVPEPYVDRKQMAEAIGVSLSTLDSMVARNEIPSVTWGRRTRRFQVSVVIAALERAANERKAA